MVLPPLIVLIDGACPMCRRTARWLHRADWLGRLSFEDAADASVRARVAPDLDEAAALTAMHVVAPDGSRRAGYEGFLRIAGVVPLLWAAAIVGRLPGVRALGHAAYRRIAAGRARDHRCTDALCGR